MEQNRRKKKSPLKGQEGFTLIEIIAVIIIMGILAAVAVPKFFSMQEDAKIAACHGALSEAQARFNHAYAKYILLYKKAPTAVATSGTDVNLDTANTDPAHEALLGTNATADPGTDIGDFTVTWTKTGADELTITILTADTIGADALSDLPATVTSKVVNGITWGS